MAVTVKEELAKHHGTEAAELVAEIRGKPNEAIKKKMMDFAEANGSNNQKVAGLTGALLEGFRRTKDNNHKATYGSALIYLASSMNERGEALMKQLDKLNEDIKKKGDAPQWVVPREKIEDMNAFYHDLLGMNITKNNESMLMIRKGALPVEASEGFMKVLLDVYYRSGYAVGIKNVIDGVTYNLTIGIDEIQDRINRAKNQYEFAGLKAK
ncbi:MAG: hypothetical protein Sv326_0746 [Candidatus Fermentimicrarchaeum limneticum]|uniref:Uncharacterized protein n=1 Tax=Fermentimicrarchaeum limneticum TaxID=2795018 RepID=A0A7D6BT29_FERL1|nr:MAG: hypothetical protein Sv326_0746 [Candidatus Fermentimicrarchaeum limneticum]